MKKPNSKKWYKRFFRAPGNVVRCELCGKSRTTLHSLRRHILQKHVATVQLHVRSGVTR